MSTGGSPFLRYPREHGAHEGQDPQTTPTRTGPQPPSEPALPWFPGFDPDQPPAGRTSELDRRDLAATDAATATGGSGPAWDPSWAPGTSGAPSTITVLGDVATVVTDVATGVKGPAATGHALTLVVDAAVLAGLIPAWIDLPSTLAAVLSIGGGLLAIGARAYALWQTLAKARAHQASTTAPLVAVGRTQQ